jgi:hypothetical protein
MANRQKKMQSDNKARHLFIRTVASCLIFTRLSKEVYAGTWKMIEQMTWKPIKKGFRELSDMALSRYEESKKSS